MGCQYRVLAREDQIGHKFRFKEYPDLEFTYLEYQNNLCPSNYSDAKCVWAGYLEVTFEVNGKIIKLRNNQDENSITIKNKVYQITGCDFLVKNRSRDSTWLYFDIKKS